MVDGTSSQSSTIRYRAAGFWRRCAAGILDLIFLSPLFIVFFWGLSYIFQSPSLHMRELSPDLFLSYLIEQNRVGKSFFFLVVIILFLYHFLFHSLLGSTIGERIFRLKVIDVYGERPKFLRTLIRTLSMGISLALAGAGFLWIAFDRERRAFHDWRGGTYVVLMNQKENEKE